MSHGACQKCPCGESGCFLFNIQSDTQENFLPPLGKFLESQEEEDFCHYLTIVVTYKEVALSRRAVLSAQRHRGGFRPPAWTVPVLSPGPSCCLFCPRLHPAFPHFGFLDIIKIFWEVVRAAKNLWTAGNSLWCVIYYHVVPNMSWSLSHVGRKCTHSAPGCPGESVRIQSGHGLAACFGPSLRGHCRFCWPSRVAG